MQSESVATAEATVSDVRISLRATVEAGGSIRCALECDGRKAIVIFRPNDVDVDVESG